MRISDWSSDVCSSDLYFTARYFGIKNYGRIYGFLYTGVALGAGLGPFCFAFLSDITGSYVASFQAALGLFLFGGVSILLLGRYHATEDAHSTSHCPTQNCM